MKTFRYKAKDKNGKLITGEVQAADVHQAAKLIRQQGYISISIKEKREIPLNFIKKLQDHIGSGDITNFTRQLATMINAGLPLTEALLILRTQSKAAMQKVVSQVLADVEEGEPLSSAMRKHPAAFSKTYIALVRSGETGGVLDKVLLSLADDLERQQEFIGKVKGALIYPAVIIVGMIGVALVMLIFVIPRLLSMYEDFNVELPLPTKILIFISSLFTKFWPILLIVSGLAIYGFKGYRQTEEGRKKTDELLLKIPVLGELQMQIMLADLTRTLSLMVGSGVSILEGLSISAEVASNTVVADALIDVGKMVEKGFPLALAFSRHPEAFPFIVSQMVAVGEETGKMDEVLAKVNHIFEVEIAQKVKTITSLVEPIILVFLGIGVAFLLVSIILPIYTLTTSI